MTTIVMTGGTNGIGRVAADLMRRTAGVRLLVGARDRLPSGIETAPLDLSRLASVRSFADAVKEWLGNESIDTLVLNAGIQARGIDQRTIDGFETTFAVNHLAHYLLLRLLAPRLAPGAIVVITTSNLHDPRTNSIAPPKHADARRLAKGEVLLAARADARDVLRAYAASKLCNVVTARVFASLPSTRERGLRVIAFNPGFTPGTQLTRNHALPVRIFFATCIPVLSVFQRMNTVAGGGALLMGLALGKVVPPTGRFYGSQVKRRLTWPDPSDLASNDAVGVKLWNDSATMVGLPPTP
jgi:NAD(P)-dependent dehydrogenase (short-subunit alcohol dehydrogenase family)